MGIKLAAASGGSVELVPTNTASNFTATMPARTGNVAVDGPAFSAYNNASQTITSGVATKLQSNTEVFDTNGNYDSATNYRFTPTVSGYYQANGVASYSGTGLSYAYVAVYKNGSLFAYGNYSAATSGAYTSSISCLIYLNGSTDYIELYGGATATAGSVTSSAGSAGMYFQAAMVRAA
jgi:hypothetical protein